MSKELKNTVDNINAKIENKHGFSVPENYFNTVESNLSIKLIEQQFPTENGLSVSKTYFDSLENHVFSKIDFSTKETKIIKLRRRALQFIPAVAAASILLFFGLNYFSLTNSISFDNINTSDIENWLEEGNLDNNSNNEVFVDADFTDTNTFEDQTLSDEELLNYFNTIDNTTLLTEIES